MVVTNKIEDNALIGVLLGGIGNNLFEIANLYCVSRDTHRPFYLYLVDPVNGKVKNDFLDVFNRFNVFYDMYLANNGIIIKQPQLQPFFDLRNYIGNEKEKYYVLGYFQDEKYFKKYKQEVKNLFYCPEFIKNAIYNRYGELYDYVSIHVRRGDYVDIGNLVPDDYYEKAYHNFFEGRDCIIISDDIDWCKKNIHIPNAIFCEKYVNSSYSSLFDFYCGVFCRDHIISNSTFAWWQAYLGERETSLIIAPWKWYICDFWNGVKADIIPERWTKFNPNYE